MVPSVDRVGRYFPLTLVAELPPGMSVLSAASQTAACLDAAERLVIDTLAAEQVDLETFDDEIMQLGEELTAAGIAPRIAFDPIAAQILDAGGKPYWQMPIDSPSQLAPAFEELLSQRLATLYEPLVLWWTSGSSVVVAV